ncbi:MAG: radical SAM protein [Treponema sp.]|nr:radical SAM protein [Treponema sp.]
MTKATELLYQSCTQCPRNCKADRLAGKTGFCQEPADIRLATACLHFGEEPLITVHGGSGTIFITGCTLRCAFCQNYQISQQGMGNPITSQDFTDICLHLQDAGAENINIVTGSHCIPLLAEYLADAKAKGLTLPICWNSSGYESVKTLKLLKDLVHIWLPDLKTLNSTLSKELFGASNYPQAAKEAITWMIQNNPLRFSTKTANGIEKDKLEQGVIIRHLFLPGRFEETVETLSWLKENADGKAVISLMSQYTPVPFKGSPAELQHRTQALQAIENRLVTKTEDTDLRDIIEAFDFDYLFYQDLSDDTDWLPDFNRTQPFSNALAKPVWHWNKGLLPTT